MINFVGIVMAASLIVRHGLGNAAAVTGYVRMLVAVLSVGLVQCREKVECWKMTPYI